MNACQNASEAVSAIWSSQDEDGYFSSISDDESLSSSTSPCAPNCLNVVSLNVGGHKFSTRLSTLIEMPDTYFAHRFSGRFKMEADGSGGGEHFIDRDPKMFRHILNYLRTRQLHLPLGPNYQHLYEALLEEARFFGIGPLEDDIRSLLEKQYSRKAKVSINKRDSNISAELLLETTERFQYETARLLRQPNVIVHPIATQDQSSQLLVPISNVMSRPPLVFDDLDF